jgi:hypothetical protein
LVLTRGPAEDTWIGGIAVAAIDGSKFKAVNARDKNFTKASIQRRMEQVEASIEHYMAALETADRQDGELAPANSVRLKDNRRHLDAVADRGYFNSPEILACAQGADAGVQSHGS